MLGAFAFDTSGISRFWPRGMARPPKRLDRKATIFARKDGRDAAGGFTTIFEQVGPERYCHREDQMGGEAREVDATRSEASAIFTLQWFSGLTSEMRLGCESKLYDIVAPPVEQGRRQWWLVSAKERPAQA